MDRKAVDTRGHVRLAKKFMYLRLVFVFLLIFLSCAGLVARVVSLNKNKGDTYEKKVLAQQSYVSNAIANRRGDIVDRNGNRLATSVRVYNLVLDPKLIQSDEKYIEPTFKALNKSFGISEKDFKEILENNPSSQYYVVQEYKRLSRKTVKAFEEYKKVKTAEKGASAKEKEKLKAENEEKRNIKGIWFEEEYVRKYPYSTVASNVIGFCNSDNTGLWGIENYYNSSLTGSDGHRYGYYDSDLNLVENVIEPVNGNTIVSTIDINVQGVVEQHMKKFQESIGSKKMGCIIMNPKNGDIYAMASYPQFDLNNPSDLTKFYTKKQIAKMSDAKKKDVLNGIWRNYCISDSYEPGSTFKPITVAAALDEGVTKDGIKYKCDGGQQVRERYIKCVAHARGGHGSTDICQALKWSCNDVLMRLGKDLGKTKFLEYVNSFGLGKKTGIDLPGEGTGIIFNEDTLGDVQLATSSFGQSQTVTMVQMAAAFSAVINGGNYYKPHVVKEVDTASGAEVSSNDSLLVKRVISEDTSAYLRDYLYKTVADEDGTASPARVKGYEIGGKTGTAEKQPRGQGNYLVSFIGFSNKKDPDAVIYVVIDEPNVEDQAHSTYATEFASDVMKDVFPMLGLYPDSKVAKSKKNKNSAAKIKLPSTKDGNLIEAPKGGFANGDYE